MDSILNKLGINEFNYGACSGKDKWSENSNAKILESFNPANGKLLASVYMAEESDYNNILNQSIESFKEFRKVPAPVRGELVRQMGDALRDKKDALGSLVSLLSLIHI